MRKGDIDRFFKVVSQGVRVSCKVYLTGGIASWFLGGNRPTEDIDFGLRVSRGHWQEVAQVFQETSQSLGIPIQFSENISRWSLIDLPQYEKRSRQYKKFGKVSVYLLDVGTWSIGKVSRYYASDVSDLQAVFKAQKPHPDSIIRVWARSLKESPHSSHQFLFIKTVEDFLNRYGRKIWGRKFNSQKYFLEFKRLARIRKLETLQPLRLFQR